MIMIKKENGIVVLEMNQKDADSLAKIISSMDETALPFLEEWEKEIQSNLPNILMNEGIKFISVEES